MRKKWTSILLFCLVTVYADAQTAGYQFYSPLDSVKTSGFYNIEITPALSACLKTDYSDLRIVNDAGRWVPHVLHFPAGEIINDEFYLDLKYAKIENSKVKTVLIIENEKSTIADIGLEINNTVAKRFCTLSGSDDNKNWFVISDSILVDPEPAETGTASTFFISFPPAKYRFYKIVIQNNNKDPFDIRGIVRPGTAANVPTKLFQNPAAVLLQKDSGKISYIKITLQQPYHIDNISLKLNAAKYFSRKVDLYIPEGNAHSFSSPGQWVQSFTISNNSSLQFNMPLSKATVFYLLINNEDNLPLQVADVITAVNYRYVTAYLEKGNNYKLILHNEAAVVPNYDLADINTKITDSIGLLAAGKIVAVNENTITIKPVKNNNRILWAVIIMVLIILLLFTQKMIAEVNKRKQDDSI